MSKLFRLTVALAGAAVMMTALGGSASARSLSSSDLTLRAAWREMVFTAATGSRVICPVTLEGSLQARTIPKVAYTLMGRITRAVLGSPCVGGTATILTETLPWHVKYQGFTGILPRIERILTLIVDASFRVRLESGLTCLFRTTDAEHALGTFTRDTTTGELTSAEVGPSEITSTEACAFGLRTRGRLTGTTTSLTVLNSTTRLRVTLI